jgi:hypothetical protein
LLGASLALKVALQGPTNGQGTSGPVPAYAVMTTAGVSTEVRLSTWPTEDELVRIADTLRSPLAAGDRALIFFYLPLSFGDSPGAPWARAMFTPETTIKVYGFTPKTLAKAAALADQIPEQIGAWMWNQGGGSEVIVISTKQGQLMRTDLTIGGDSLKYSYLLHETRDGQGRRFQGADTSGTGDYYVLLPDGDLVLGDKEGPFSSAKPLKKR